jgi:hypothetical protein
VRAVARRTAGMSQKFYVKLAERNSRGMARRTEHQTVCSVSDATAAKRHFAKSEG